MIREFRIDIEDEVRNGMQSLENGCKTIIEYEGPKLKQQVCGEAFILAVVNSAKICATTSVDVLSARAEKETALSRAFSKKEVNISVERDKDASPHFNMIVRNLAANFFSFDKFRRKCQDEGTGLMLTAEEARKQFKLQDQSLCAKKEVCLSQILPYIGIAWFLQRDYKYNAEQEKILYYTLSQ